MGHEMRYQCYHVVISSLTSVRHLAVEFHTYMRAREKPLSGRLLHLYESLRETFDWKAATLTSSFVGGSRVPAFIATFIN